LPPEKVRKLLVKDVPVVLNWRLSEEVDGRIVSDLQIRTVEINGSIKRATAKRITVTALPAQMPADEPPPIEAGGRTRQPPRPAGPPKKPMQPRTLNLLVSPEISAFTLDGEKVAFKELKPSMKFDAVIMDGGPALIFELRARNHDGSDDQGPDRTTGRSSDDKSAGRRGMEAKDKSRRS
jgi:hypothetical protein